MNAYLHYSDIDLCDLEIKYKGDSTVLGLINTIKNMGALEYCVDESNRRIMRKNDRIEDLEYEVNDLKQKISKLESEKEKELA